MAERSNAAVLKTVDCHRSGGSNPSLSAEQVHPAFFICTMPCLVYILYSDTHSRYYIGQTANVCDRLQRHNKGMEKSTAPWGLILFIEKPGRGDAMILERKLKNLNTGDLEQFILKYGGSLGPGAAG